MTPSSHEDTASRAIREILGDEAPGRAARGPGGEWYVPVEESGFDRAIRELAARKFVLISLFGTEGFAQESRFSLLYVFERKEGILVLVRAVADGRATSIATIFPSASWPERECRDGFGIEFAGAFDTRRLLLHEPYQKDFHPLKKEFANAPVATNDDVPAAEEYQFRAMTGEGVYQVAVGPVHAGIIEPGHFRFSVIGETVFNLEIRMFYTHRGIEKLAEGKLPGDCVKVAEAVSGDESVANAVAFCMAVERISGITVPDRAWFIRTILAELERCCSHLGDQAGMLTDVAFALGASQFSVLREEVFRKNAELTGSRFLRGMTCIGGVTRDIPKDRLADLAEFVGQLKKRFRVGLSIVLSTPSVIDRFSTTGVVKRELLRPLNITGPVARASGGRIDVRLDHPYGVYDRFVPSHTPLDDGDVLARFTVKAQEFLDSLDLIERLIAAIPEGAVLSTEPVRDGYALALVESARGQNLCWVKIKDGKIDRYKVRTASYCNWLAIEHAVPGNILADFPVINKSMNLSYAGTDM
ncbi:NADH-quinone oxidoreductase subunit C [Methanoregula sp. UBA64]|jgi:formate hydrogenlyase subunit 5|uniref:hydrogenase large subunit n=1 Tax=Methanoregula sp. UBA64 TaxID=1915554 RepID=UPI0025CECD73|nr:NADH-quinone oxidoreductase subunit C [Methanoregula sp. UBA64]